ncbi:MAG TPA: hypothetical protein DCR44_08235 [Acholeplasmatales bacterium]|nr:MAG: hypothetical protein A2Y16_02985 [Tenericutes bacterium GWF2_57_13]HAQ57355.1 hypothetical protein [Acholeplasmatales bacterium]
MKIVNIKADKLRYQANSLAYSFCLLGLALGVTGLFTLITYDAFGAGDAPTRVVPDFRIGLEIAVSIVMMLLTFLAAEKAKSYDPLWSTFGLFLLASVTLLRIADFGTAYQGITHYCFDRGWIPAAVQTKATVMFFASALFLYAAAIVSTVRVFILHRHLKEIARHGNA